MDNAEQIDFFRKSNYKVEYSIMTKRYKNNVNKIIRVFEKECYQNNYKILNYSIFIVLKKYCL